MLLKTSYPAATFVVSANPPEVLTDSGYGTALVDLADGASTTVTITVTAKDVGEVVAVGDSGSCVSATRRNGYCANHSGYQQDHGCRYDSRADYHAMFNILSGSGL